MNFHYWVVIDGKGDFLSKIIRGKPYTCGDDLKSAEWFDNEDNAQLYVSILNGEEGVEYEIRELYARVE